MPNTTSKNGSKAVAALHGGGVYTWLPEPGAVIRQDQPVYSVGDEPVLNLDVFAPARADYAHLVGWMADGSGVEEGEHP